MLLWWAARALADCPPVDWPPGLDLPAARVEVLLRTDAEGRVVEVLEALGPEPLVAAVREVLPGCALPAAATVRHGWSFPRPPVNVAGLLRARGTRDPLAGELVLVGDRTARTDAEGQFELRNVAPGEHVVRLADPAWWLPAATLVVEAGRRVEVELWAGPGRVEAELVAVYDPDEGRENLVARVVDLEDATALPGTLGDPLRALAGQPGLARAPFDSGWLLVRGGEYDEVGLFVEGVRVPLVYHLGGFTSILHPELVGSVDFWPGLFPARYGQALSGAVDLKLREVGERPYAAVGANVVFATAWAETPTPWGGIAVGARRSWLDGVLALALDPEAAAIAPRFWDAEVHATVGEGSVTLFALSDAIDAPSFDGEGTLVIEQQALQAQAIVPIGHVRVQPYVAWMGRTVVGREPDTIEPQAVTELYPGLRVLGDVDLGPAVVSLGAEGQRHGFGLERDTASVDAAVWSGEPFAGLSIGDTIRGWSEVRAAFHLVEDDPLQPVRVGLSPRAGVSARPREHLEVHGSFGRMVATPTPTLWLGVAEGAYLDLERSDQASVGVALGDERTLATVDLWSRQARDLAEIELDGSIGQLEGRADGVESTFRLARAGFVGTALAQLTRSQKREEPGDAWTSSPFEVPVRVELTALQRLPRAFEVSGRFRATSGFPRTLGPAVTGPGGALQPTEAYDLLLQRTVDLGLPDDQARLAPYHALDLRIARTFTFRAWELATSLDVQNVYSRRVVEPVITGFGESRPSYGFGLPVLPIFSVEGRFWP